MELERIVQYLDDYLDIPAHPDYANALNGLQVEGDGPVESIAVAVDASEDVIRATIAGGHQLLIVHHGLFWGGLQPVVGRHYRKLKALMDSGTALYSAHLPLDAHPMVGNCAVLARALGVEITGPFGDFQGITVGWRGRLDQPRDVLREHLSETVRGEVRLIPGGPARVEEVAIVTGGAGSLLGDVASAGIDTYITGEGSHHTYVDAMELGVNLLYAGHYATETWGVQSLALHLESEFGITWEFLDFPSGM